MHTLERVADMVECDRGQFHAYAPFSTDPKRRHLFRQYQNVRGKTLLQSKDRLSLTASIVGAALNVETLKKQGMVSMCREGDKNYCSLYLYFITSSKSSNESNY